MATKYGMVLDVNRCIGCYTCVVACKMAYGTRPGVNYNGVDWVEWGQYPDAKQRFVLTMCNHCENAPCVEGCPTNATYATEEGAVVIDYDTCIGCGECVKNCPYGQRHLVVDDEMSFEGAVLPYEEQTAGRVMVAEKCTFCYARAQDGLPPMCTMHCPAQCRIFGDVNDPESDISKYIKDNNALQIEGTSMYYVIPEGMDRNFLPASLADAWIAHTQAQATPAPAATPAPVATPTTPEPAQQSNTGALVAGAVGVAAVAVAGVAYSKNKKKKDGKGGAE